MLGQNVTFARKMADGRLLFQVLFMECEILRSPMISYRSLLYSTTVLYDYVKISKKAQKYPKSMQQVKRLQTRTNTVILTHAH